MSGAALNRFRSKQDYATPQIFFDFVCKRFGTPRYDLAASPENAKAPKFFTKEDDSLSKCWPEGELCWLNPPYADISPWARKCRCYKDITEILFLVPASVGSNWFLNDVMGIADVYFISPRLSFDGKNPFPKDCLLARYGRYSTGRFIPLRWK